MRYKNFVDYEWVVEPLDADGDIIDGYYFDEKDRDEALAQLKSFAGAPVDFGLCRHAGNDVEGELDRQYAYRAEDGSWPDEFDQGAAIPKRIRKVLPGA
jgi:hypothetical protein